jgi:UTP--glucose-1-phosphate uridylyltransferase
MATASGMDYRQAFSVKMKSEGIDPAVIKTFLHFYGQVLSGETGLVSDKELQPLQDADIEHWQNLATYAKKGGKALHRAVRIVLNGGLGTSMGLTGPKSLLGARDGHSFLDIILSQSQEDQVPLCLMNSFSTDEETRSELTRLEASPLPHLFTQNKFPKILQETLAPAAWQKTPQTEWNPPGHGDVYISLYTSGLLEKLLAQGIEYAFISNSDNLGASLDHSLLGYFAEKNCPFMMEVAQRRPSDAKGGHLARHESGRLMLREIAQCPIEELDAFQDICKYRFFNTNNIWVNLTYLQALISKDGTIRLPIILNAKHLDPRDEESPNVLQIETAMGAAISLFKGAGAVAVPRGRFLPVKTCNDLLALRSDRFLLQPDKRLILNPNNETDTIRIQLDPAYYGKIEKFDERFSKGPPSLLACEGLTVRGDVYFESDITIKGCVIITNSQPYPVVIPKGTVIERDLTF